MRMQGPVSTGVGDRPGRPQGAVSISNAQIAWLEGDATGPWEELRTSDIELRESLNQANQESSTEGMYDWGTVNTQINDFRNDLALDRDESSPDDLGKAIVILRAQLAHLEKSVAAIEAKQTAHLAFAEHMNEHTSALNRAMTEFKGRL